MGFLQSSRFSKLYLAHKLKPLKVDLRVWNAEVFCDVCKRMKLLFEELWVFEVIAGKFEEGNVYLSKLVGHCPRVWNPTCLPIICHHSQPPFGVPNQLEKLQCDFVQWEGMGTEHKLHLLSYWFGVRPATRPTHTGFGPNPVICLPKNKKLGLGQT